MIKKYKNKKWLKNKLVNEKVSMAEIGRMFDKDITIIRYWRNKFEIEVEKNVKYPVKEYTCPVCGKEFKKRVTKEVQTVYCSQDCAYKGRSLGYTKRNVEGGYDSSPTKIEITCNYCGKDFIVEKTEKNRKYCSRECFLKARKEEMQGSNNPSWIDGRSYNKRCYRGNNWEIQRKKCYERDNYKCQICGVKCVGRRDIGGNSKRLIQAHHIEKYESGGNNRLENLVTLCASCHKKLHEGEINYEMD